MRRFPLLLALIGIFSLAPSPTAAATRSCTIHVTPSKGTGTTTYRISGRHFPSTSDGSPLEVDIDITRLTWRDPTAGPVTIFFLWLIPGGHRFYVDFNQPGDGQPPLKPGRYGVAAETPHQAGCRTSDVFTVST